MRATKKTAVTSVKGKRTSGEKKAVAKRNSANEGKNALTLDRRTSGDRRNHSSSAGMGRPVERRAKVNRRRQIDPTTCERDYTVDEVEFMTAMDEYKRRNGRMFPTCSEVLEVIKSLGYEKRPKVDLVVATVDETIETVTNAVTSL